MVGVCSLLQIVRDAYVVDWLAPASRFFLVCACKIQEFVTTSFRTPSPNDPGAHLAGPTITSLLALAHPTLLRNCTETGRAQDPEVCVHGLLDAIFYSSSDLAGDIILILTLPRCVCLSFSVEISTRIVSKMEIATCLLFFFPPLGTTTL